MLNVAQLPSLAQDSVSWLRQLGRPSWIDIPGIDSSRRRVLTTLLHGNEPSGVLAIHRWLQGLDTPAVNISLLIASVTTALQEPVFSRRMAAGQRDLNRCFKAPFNDQQGHLAQQIMERIISLQPECVIDIHNTSGSGPSFAVATADGFAQRNLAGFFCRRLIVTDLRLGSLMEIDAGCPAVTIECGGARDEESQATALAGIENITTADVLFPAAPRHELEVLHHPVRVILKPAVTVTYSASPSEDSDVTLWPDIERCNYGITPVDRCLGWVGPGGLRQLAAPDTAGIDRVSHLLREDNGWLYPARNLRLFMATTNAKIARDDCLFYAVAAT
ncbi:succinylglutamate desuccinylase/aspartoacylase domain-containing protein [Exilibacterium tricleocarpae]|uniref:succinylglutamate desuccinylase/aspartoacylase domain-containing protein n=1 Tax=Exilibacterium tricleocarpae TaxID=2591008 RepID=UPI0015D2AA50|nr:succinylglutamate desuccinylase/aspartoacylase family protein [Exilibacterium tricleocarpae]